MSETGAYIHGHSAEVLKAHARRTAARDAAYLIPHLRPDFRILDVGCGPGTISADLAALVPAGRVTCVELGAGALDAARQTFAQRGVVNADFVVGDVTARLPFADGTFDVVHAHMVVIHLPQPAAALREMRRVAKPGGLVASKDMIMATTTWFPPDARLALWERGITATIAATGADPQMGRSLRAAALEAGFAPDKIDARASCWSFADDEAVAFWGRSCAARMAPGSELRKKIVAGGYATEQQADEFVAASQAWVEEAGAWFGCMNGELLAWK
ncbi:S-adenosyl-L-methionine-dependent methyltransferase [Lasiosphaeria ovina]|uniref:S-adenosyl-L-methionine-dependent methyltransferase n=1 Tax=Lasiosphaeria ovina TaxID=92902 RepID=A0AAE0K4K9_9PEZI|nr:S-adenosyl-L-methionine-dependent methyltransferase [Lasiosphaeria ovina]